MRVEREIRKELNQLKKSEVIDNKMKKMAISTIKNIINFKPSYIMYDEECNTLDIVYDIDKELRWDLIIAIDKDYNVFILYSDDPETMYGDAILVNKRLEIHRFYTVECVPHETGPRTDCFNVHNK